MNHARTLNLASLSLRDAFLTVDPVVVEDKKANRGLQISVAAICID